MTRDGQAPVTTEQQDEASFYAVLSKEIDDAMDKLWRDYDDWCWNAPLAVPEVAVE